MTKEKRQIRQCVLLNCDPHTTAHFWAVASEMFRGTFIECEEYERKTGHSGFIWNAEYWDKGQD
jgi:hypothetical protein